MPKKITIVFFLCILFAGCESDAGQTYPIRPTVSISSITEIVDSHGHEMVLIPGGMYYSVDHWWSRLDSYYIDKYEVTIGQYFDYRNSLETDKENPLGLFYPDVENYQKIVEFSIGDGFWIVEEESRDYPIVGITWYGAREYCEWRGGGLPSESQFIKASRGLDHRPYPWGYDTPDCEKIGIGDCTEGWLHQVGKFPAGASPYGVMDLVSNVAEWSNDIWYGEPNDDDDRDEVLVWGPPFVRIETVDIGGIFHTYPSNYKNYIGFRCVLEP